MASRLQQINDILSSHHTKMAPKLNENGIPSFDDLPLREGDPHHSAWGLYGDNDELGTLNRLTDERVAAAAKNEIHKGIRYVGSVPKVYRVLHSNSHEHHHHHQQDTDSFHQKQK